MFLFKIIMLLHVMINKLNYSIPLSSFDIFLVGVKRKIIILKIAFESFFFLAIHQESCTETFKVSKTSHSKMFHNFGILLAFQQNLMAWGSIKGPVGRSNIGLLLPAALLLDLQWWSKPFSTSLFRSILYCTQIKITCQKKYRVKNF